MTRAERRGRDAVERKRSRVVQSQQQSRAQKGGQPNELGVTQGQNGEQGNSEERRNNEPIGRPGEE